MTKLKDSTVLITGVAAGIGKLMGQKVLERGAKALIIWDINEKQMLETAAELSILGNVKGILPIKWFDKIVGKHLGVYSSMQGFKGHYQPQEEKPVSE